jgi:hypothetical protein
MAPLATNRTIWTSDEYDQKADETKRDGEYPRPEAAEPGTNQYGEKGDGHPAPADRR